MSAETYRRAGERWTVLRFDLDLVERLVEHSRHADLHRMSFAERMKVYGEGVWDSQPDEEERAAAAVILVKDAGIYLMSNGVPHLQDPQRNSERASLVAYAEGFDPRKGDVWEAGQRAAGGDDFAEHIDLDTFEGLLHYARSSHGQGKVEIHVSPTSMAFMSIDAPKRDQDLPEPTP